MSKVRICYETVAAPGITEKKVEEILHFQKNHKILSIEPVPETLNRPNKKEDNVVPFMFSEKSKLWSYIFAIIKQLMADPATGDAMDMFSATDKIEEIASMQECEGDIISSFLLHYENKTGKKIDPEIFESFFEHK
jgi:hypothetical protein